MQINYILNSDTTIKNFLHNALPTFIRGDESKRHLVSGLKVILLPVILTSCSGASPKKLPDYGLQKIEIQLSNKNIAKLNNGVHSKDRVRGWVTIDGFRYQTDINYAGATTINHFKKNFDLAFNTLAPFGDLNLAKVRLSATVTDQIAISSSLATRYFKQLGVLTPNYSYSVVYLNGKYLGLYNVIEPIDGDFFERRGLSAASIYKARNISASMGPENLRHIEKAFSSRTAEKNYQDIKHLIRTCLESLQSCLKGVDRENFSKYIATAISVDHLDGVVNNFVIYRAHNEQQFKLVTWDLDRTFAFRRPDIEERMIQFKFVEQNLVFSRLLQEPTFQDSISQHWLELNSKEFVDEIVNKIDADAETIRAAWQADIFFSQSKINFDRSIANLKAYIRRNTNSPGLDIFTKNER